MCISDLKNGGLKDLDFTSQGISARDIITDQYSTAIVNAEQSGNYWTFYYEYGGAKRYLKDGTYYPINYAIACGGASDHLWTLEAVDDEDNYFGVNATQNVRTKYYTSLYTAFPYLCDASIKAMYADSDKVLYEIVDGKVPAYTPVILECSSPNAVDNKIMPIFEDLAPISNNALQGHFGLNGQTVVNNGNIYIYGRKSSLKADFILLTDSVVPANTAYFVDNSSEARSLNIVSGIRDVKENNTLYSEIYDLSGRKINTGDAMRQKGLYIVGGKKVVVK